jgi:hypothetical protein
MPAAPYEQGPNKWPDLDWRDRHTGDPLQILTLDGR